MWTTAVPFKVSFDPPARGEGGRDSGVGDFGPVEKGTEGFRGFGLALGVRLGRRIFGHHQCRRIQRDLEGCAGGVHPRVIDGHADCSHDGYSDDRHQWGYTAPGVLEETGQHAAHPTVVKTTYLQSSSIWGYPP